jgi:hypothetical protein
MDWGKRRRNEWLAYFPEDGQTIEDATLIMGAYDAEDAAKQAVEYDFGNRDGWERTAECEFKVIVVSPDDKEFEFMGWNEPSVDHRVRPVKRVEAQPVEAI